MDSQSYHVCCCLILLEAWRDYSAELSEHRSLRALLSMSATAKHEEPMIVFTTLSRSKVYPHKSTYHRKEGLGTGVDVSVPWSYRAPGEILSPRALDNPSPSIH